MEQQGKKTPVCIDKGVVYDGSGRAYERYAVKTHFVTLHTDKIELVRRYILPVFRSGDLLFITAKIMSMCEGLVYTREQAKPGIVARFLHRFAGHIRYDENGHPLKSRGYAYSGSGVFEPYRMQLMINIVGMPRFLFACLCSALTKPFGIHGVFYKVCGHDVAGIDGFSRGAGFPEYRELAIVNPVNSGGLCDEIHAATGIPCAVMDSNDIAARLLGKSSGFPLSDADIFRIMGDNPEEQGMKLTPFVLVRPCGESEEKR